MPIDITRTQSAAEAAKIVSTDPTAFVFGGGTTLMRRIHEGDQKIRHLVLLKGQEFGAIDFHQGGIKLGAQVRMSDILSEPSAEVLHEAARSVGAPALRNMASVGGNLFAPPPYGDLATVFLALGAEVEIATPNGIETLALEKILQDRDSRRVITAIVIPNIQSRKLHFVKMTRSHPRGASIVTVAALLQVSSGRVADASIAFGGLAGRPFRDHGVEQALKGVTLSETTIEAAIARIGEGIEPFTDALASGWYRKQMAGVQLRRLMNDLRIS
jgi:CO/xanthine dehydrogenase FAD-binding subunit